MNTTADSFTEPTGRVVGAEHFRTDGTRAVLRVTRCRACDSAWFPALAQCANCASRDVADELTSSTGTAYACTVVRIGPPQFEPPYVLAYVDIDGVRVLTHVQSADVLTPGTPVELVFAPIGADEHGPVLSYAVTPSQRGETK